MFAIIAVTTLLAGNKAIDNPPEVNNKKADIDQNPKFHATKKIDGYLLIDENNKQWKAPKCTKGNTVYNFSDLLDFELLEDGAMITDSRTNTDLLGAVLLNPFVASKSTTSKTSSTCKKMQIRISVNNLKNPSLKIDLVTAEVQKGSSDYKKAADKAQNIIAALKVISSNA